MTTHRDPMLDEDERRLAEQLARIAPRGEPSAELDARILAMAAGDPAYAPVTATRRRPRRWPVWLGVAASLTAVAGLVWRLEPILHPGQPVRYEAPVPVAADNDPNARRAPVEYVATQVAADAVPPPPPPMMPAPVASTPPKPVSANTAALAKPASTPPAADAAREAEEAVATDASAPAAMAAKRVVADRDLVQEMPRRPAPLTVEATAAVALPPAPPAPVAASAIAERSRATAQPKEAPAARVAVPAPPPAATPPPSQDRAGFDARPPTTADSPEVRQAWLVRIRELRDAGSLDEARASLKAFVQRYPKAEIPADLKPLLPPPPPSPAP